MPELEADPAPPRIVLVASLGLLVLMVGGAVAAGVLVSRAAAGPVASSASSEPSGNTPVEAPTRRPTSAAASAGACSTECSFPQTTCIDRECRLAPGARWKLTPLRTLTDGAPSLSSSQTCVQFGGQSRVCFTGKPGGKEAHLTAYDVVAAPSFLVRTEDLAIEAVQIDVDGDAGFAPQSRYIASSTMFGPGLMLRVRKDGTGVRFRITPAP